jgi:hypothetical protein
MKHLIIVIALLLTFSSGAFAQRSKKGFEYTGTKTRVSLIGKSKMFSEGVKPVDYTIYWNKKKNLVVVNAGPKEKWYTIELAQIDTIHGNITHIGFLEGTSKNPDASVIDKNRYEVRFLMDRVSVKIGEARLEEYLLEGATIWDDRPMNMSNEK